MPTSHGIQSALLALFLTGTNVIPATEEPATPPTPPSPVAQFRVWLELPQAERELALAERPENVRTLLLSKLAEYEAMDPSTREIRLRATELQYYLRPLLRLSPADRDQRLAQIPPGYRSSVNQRLLQWDQLAPDTRAELLQNGWAIRYLVRLESANESEQTILHREVPAERRAQFDTELARWKSLPASQRQDITRAFHRFFELPLVDQQRALGSLPESERRQIQATLDAFAKLAPAQRQLCIDSFRKFASFTPRERAEFLRNADRWREMSPADRATWRALVSQLPPLPPTPIAMPPSPLDAVPPAP